MSNKDRIFWGVCLCAAAVLLVLQSFEIIGQDFVLGSVLALVLSGFVMISGIVRKKLPSFIIGLCFLILSIFPVFGLNDFPVLSLVCALAVGATGLYWLCPEIFNVDAQGKFKRGANKSQNTNPQHSTKTNTHTRNPYKLAEQKYSKTTSRTNRGWYRLTNKFKNVSKYVETDNFKSAYIENKFGRAHVHFEKLIIMGENISIRVENSFGSTTLHIPSSWNISIEPKCLMGKVDYSKKPSNQTGINAKITAQTNFGKISIKWV